LAPTPRRAPWNKGKLIGQKPPLRPKHEAQARNGGAGALEEDARLTALFLWTVRSTASNGASESVADDENEEEPDEGEDAATKRPRLPRGCSAAASGALGESSLVHPGGH
jgi:hypothetical protein